MLSSASRLTSRSLGRLPKGLPFFGEAPQDETALMVGQIGPQKFFVSIDVRLVRPS
jgi:hypothetical protein